MRIPNHHRLPLLTVVAVGVLAMLAATLLLSWPQSAFAQDQQGNFTELGVPTNLTAGSTGQKSIVLFWIPARSTAAVGNGYMIERSEDGTTGWETAANVSGAIRRGDPH